MFSLVLVGGCADLQRIELGACGNGVVEPELGEECDRFAPPGQSCGAFGDLSRQCRFTCDPTGAGPHCPPAYGCGNDGLCRQPSGHFTPLATTSLARAPQYLERADLDGDGQTDLLASYGAIIEARYATGAGHFDSSVREPFGSYLPPVLADLDLDGKADLVTNNAQGIYVLKSEPGPQLVPVPYPQVNTVDLGIAGGRIFPLQSSRGSASRLLFLHSTGAQLCASVRVACAGGLGLFIDTPAVPEQLAGRPVIASLDGSPGDELVLAFTGESRLRVLRVTATENVEVWRELTLPGRITEGAFAVHLDGDGLLDLLVGVETGIAGRSRAVAVRATAPVGGVDLASPALLPAYDDLFSPTPGGFGGPRAVMELNGDGISDFITAAGPVLGGPSLTLAGSRVTGSDRIKEAVAGDFNGDRRTDLATSSETGLGLVFVLATAEPLVFNTAFVDTERPAELLRKGDFDGNGIDDLAFIEQDTPDSSAVAVVFGRALSVPDREVIVGRLEKVVAFEPYLSAQGTDSAEAQDLVTDLIVISRSGATGESVAFMLGATDGRLRSPLGLVGADRRLVETLEWVAAGKFDASRDAQPDLWALGDAEAWILGGSGGETFPVDRMTRLPIAAGSACEKLHPGLCGARITAPLPGLVGDGVWVASGDCQEPAKVTVAQVGSSNDHPLECVEIDVQAGELLAASDLIVTDLDDSGRPELITVHGRAPDAAAKSAGLTITQELNLREAGGSLSAEATIKTWVALKGPVANGFSHLAAIQVDADPERELALLSEAGVYLANTNFPAATFDLALRLPSGAASRNIRADKLVVTDLDGDGVEDLIVTRGRLVQTFRGVPTSERKE